MTTTTAAKAPAKKAPAKKAATPAAKAPAAATPAPALKPVKVATKYRVAIRDIAVEVGWTMTQISTNIDRFERAGVVLDVHHGPADRIVAAEKVEGNSHTWVAEHGHDRKMFRVRDALVGTKNPSYLVLTPEQVARYESGRGIAAVKVIDTATA